MNGRPAWWAERFADLVERRRTGATRAPRAPRAPTPTTKRPQMAPRTPDMTRQQQRYIYRQLCKAAGVPWRTSR